MNNKALNNIDLKKKIEKMIFLLLMVYIIIVVLIGAFKHKVVQKEDLLKNWTLYVDGKKIDTKVDIDNKVKNVKSGSELVYVKKINKKKNFLYPVLQGAYMDSEIKIYIDGKKIGDKPYIKSILGRKYFEEEITGKYDKKEMKIKIKVKDSTKKTFISKLEIIDEVSILRTKFVEDIESVLVGAICLIFGIIVIIVTSLIKNKNDDVKRFFWFAMIFVCLGVFLYARMDVCEFIFPNNIITEIMIYMVLIGIIPCVYMVHTYLLKSEENKKLLKTGFGLFTGVIVMLQGLKSVIRVNVGNFNIVVIALVAEVILLIYIAIREQKLSNMIDRLFYNGMFILYGTFLTVLVGYFLVDYNTFTNVSINIMHHVIIGLILIGIVNYSYKIKEYMDSITEGKILSTMAYTDPLTGIMNRNKYEDEIEEIKRHNIKRFTVIIFDLNNLKLLNDKKGHDVGDAYIKSFSKVLRIGFGDEGFVARIGGDEFVTIIKNKYIEVEENIDAMQGLLQDMMKSYVDEEVSFAYGVASSTRKRVLDIEEVIKIADEKMYELKKKQKSR